MVFNLHTLSNKILLAGGFSFIATLLLAFYRHELMEYLYDFPGAYIFIYAAKDLTLSPTLVFIWIFITIFVSVGGFLAAHLE